MVCHTDGGREGELQVYPVIDQADPTWEMKLYHAIEEINPDVVHLQHEFGIFSHMDVPGIYDFSPRNAFGIVVPLFRWNVERRAVVTTYHSVFSRMTFEECSYYDHVMSLSTANIVHEPFQKEALPSNIGRELGNVFVIPHGAPPYRPSEDEIDEVKREMGLKGHRTAGMIGWWEPNKGFERMVSIWPRIVREVPDAVLVVAGESRPGSPTGPHYKEFLLEQIRRSPASDSIKIVFGRFSEKDFVRTICSFDFMILPYYHASQSGNLAHCYQAGIPAIVSGVEGLRSSISSSGAGIIVNDDEGLKEATIRLLVDEELRKTLAQNARNYVDQVIAWPLIARKHSEVYQWAVDTIRDESRYTNYLPERVHV